MILYMMENYIYQDVAMMIDDGDYLDAFELICYLFFLGLELEEQISSIMI